MYTKEDFEIKVPNFVRKMSDSDLEKLIDDISTGVYRVYAPIALKDGRKAGSKEVFFEDVYQELHEIYKEDISELKEKSKTLSIFKRIKCNKEIKSLIKEKNNLLNYQTYSMFTSPIDKYSDNPSSLDTKKDDLAQMARDVKEYTYKKVD